MIYPLSVAFKLELRMRLAQNHGRRLPIRRHPSVILLDLLSLISLDHPPCATFPNAQRALAVAQNTAINF